MRSVLFFIFLFALLLRGFDQLQAGKLVHTTCYLAAQAMKKSQKNQPTEPSSFKSISAQEQNAFIICEKPEENSNDAFARKNKSLTRDVPFHSRIFYLNYLYGCFPDRLPACSQLPCKYISQRALRI